MEELSEKQINEYREVFNIFDKDGDGAITGDELERVLDMLGRTCSAEEMQSLLNDVDADGNGTIEFDEFVEMMESQEKEKSTNKTKEETDYYLTFRVLDRKNQGYITETELKQAMSCMGEYLTDQQARDMLVEADIDGDGKITYHEFSLIMKAV